MKNWWMLLTLAACSGADEGTGVENAAETNLDVQVVSAKSLGGSILGNGDPRFDALKCEFYDIEPYESTSVNAVAKADCTKVLMDGTELPSIIDFTEPVAWLRVENDEIRSASMRHWCGFVEVVVAVKAAAWDADSFEGIGFYAHESALAVESTDDRVFYEKDDPRLVRIGEARLKDGELTYLYKFTGAGPCETNGTGDNPRHALEFKPYVLYEGGYERWEAVDANHGLYFQQSWDRSHDLFQ